MKKILLLLLILILTSCINETKFNITGCEYKVEGDMFSSKKEITILGNYSPMDIYIIILEESINGNLKKDLLIKLSSTNIKYISEKDVRYICKYGETINYGDDIFTKLKKISILSNRIYNYENK